MTSQRATGARSGTGSTPEDLPLTILSGALGAGKTTLLRAALTRADGRRVGVLVNDFGRIGLDASLLDDAATRTVELAGGCVCCAFGDDLGSGLEALLATTPSLDQVILEASGVADPVRLASLARTWPGYHLDGVFVCVDVTRLLAQIRDRFVGTSVQRQVDAADVLVLTHVDEDPAHERVRNWLQARLPGEPRLTGATAADALLALESRPDHGHRAADAGSPEAHAIGVHAFTLCIDAPISRAELDSRMRAWPDLLRAKGDVLLAERPDRRHVLQRVGTRWAVDDIGPWGSRPPRTAIDCLAAGSRGHAEATPDPVGHAEPEPAAPD